MRFIFPVAIIAFLFLAYKNYSLGREVKSLSYENSLLKLTAKENLKSLSTLTKNYNANLRALESNFKEAAKTNEDLNDKLNALSKTKESSCIKLYNTYLLP